MIERGELRLVTRAFVRPGRSCDFVRHVGCVGAELARAVVAAHGTVERVPIDSSMNADAAFEARATLLSGGIDAG